MGINAIKNYLKVYLSKVVHIDETLYNNFQLVTP